MKKIHLQQYDVCIGDIHQSLSDYLRDKSYTRIVIEHTVSDYVVIKISSGEEHKSLSSCEHIWSEMAAHQMDRHSLLINLGGGVIGDMGGFAASCYMRGIDFIQIPTSLLSQVDASVGGKLAIDFMSYKNFIGLFCDPKAVLVDPAFLKTLPPEQLRSGYAEMIKHGLIKSVPIWDRLSSHDDLSGIDWLDEITASIMIKKEVVAEDPKEQGLRKILNFGHTIGHALESYALSSSSPLLHGEAIALGMIAESYLSKELYTLSEDSLVKITQHIKTIYHNIPLESLDQLDKVYVLMGSDKKNKGGEVRSALLNYIGQAKYDITLSKEQVGAALAFTKVAMS